MKLIFKYLKAYRGAIVALLLFTLGQTLANLSLPDYMAKIVDQGIIGADNTVIYRYGLWMIIITLVGGAFTTAVVYYASRIGAGIAKTLRHDLFDKIESFSLAEFDQFSTASLITRNTNDIQQIQNVSIMLMRIALMAPLIGILATYKAFRIAPSMTWIMALGVIVLMVLIGIIFKLALPRFKRVQALIDKLNLVSRERLSGLRVIRAFSNEKKEEKRFSEVNRDLSNTTLFVNRLMAVLHPGIMLLLNLSVLTIIWVGAGQVDLGQLEIGKMLAFMQYAMQVIFAFHMISIIFIMIPRASVSFNRVAEILKTELSIKDIKNPLELRQGPLELEFREVCFGYTGAQEMILKDVSFIARPGKVTAIIGSTGSGKSSLVQLIPRLYDPSKGGIYINGVNVKDIKLKDLRSRISYVSQKAILFSGTIEENVAYPQDDIGQDQVKSALKDAQALDFVEAHPEGLNLAVAQAGANFSGGQKQRLAIARALARLADLYIFDDSFSAIDLKTDKALRGALKEKIKDKTLIIVAQRINTIIDADKIIVLNDGKIVAQGDHRYLLENSALYQEIARSQLSEEELKKTKL